MKGELVMNVTVRDFINSNGNTNVKWKIDGEIYHANKFVPDELFEKYVNDWTVNQWEGVIEITTRK